MLPKQGVLRVTIVKTVLFFAPPQEIYTYSQCNTLCKHLNECRSNHRSHFGATLHVTIVSDIASIIKVIVNPITNQIISFIFVPPYIRYSVPAELRSRINVLLLIPVIAVICRYVFP